MVAWQSGGLPINATIGELYGCGSIYKIKPAEMMKLYTYEQYNTHYN